MCPDAAICKLSRLQETFEFGKFDVDKLDLIVKELVRECFWLKERHHKLCSGPVRYHARRNRPVGLPIVVIVVKNSILRFRPDAHVDAR